MRTLFLFLFSLAITYGLSYRLMHLIAHVQRRSYLFFRLILFPGVVLHELAHALGCIITGTPIHTVSFWTETGGHVIHTKPKWHLLTQPIISLAPFFVGVVCILILSRYLSFESWTSSAILLFLMTSIAATLAPSKADFIPALGGIFCLSILLTGLLFAFPSLILQLEYYLHPLLTQLTTVNLMLFVFLATLVIVRFLTKRLI